MTTRSFSKYTDSDSIYLNIEVLQKGYNPTNLEDVLHRDEVIDNYMFLLRHAMRGYVPDNILVVGKTGVGKSMLTKLITDDLVISAKNVGINIWVVNVNCETFTSSANLLRFINSQMPLPIDEEEHKKVGMSIAVNFQYFCELANQYDGFFIIILDEVNSLEQPDILNRFARGKENRSLNKNVCLILITNKVKFITRLDERTRSVIGLREMLIPPYNTEQLQDILEQRVNLGLKPNVITEEALNLIAVLSAREHGDARKALELLKATLEVVDEKKKKIIEPDDVYEGVKRLEEEKMRSVILTLPVQSKMVLYACIEENLSNTYNEPSLISKIYNKYRNICNRIDTNILTARRVKDLIDELEFLEIIESIEVKSKGRYGRSSQIKVGDKDKCFRIKKLLHYEIFGQPLIY